MMLRNAICSTHSEVDTCFSEARTVRSIATLDSAQYLTQTAEDELLAASRRRGLRSATVLWSHYDCMSFVT